MAKFGLSGIFRGQGIGIAKAIVSLTPTQGRIYLTNQFRAKRTPEEARPARVPPPLVSPPLDAFSRGFQPVCCGPRVAAIVGGVRGPRLSSRRLLEPSVCVESRLLYASDSSFQR